jgi:ABC-2 type transport system ATP-binding protein
MPLARLVQARKDFANDTVLRDIELAIDSGELIAVLGTNGAGKTTLLRLLSGLLGLSEGNLFIDGELLNRLSESQRRKIFFLPDFPALFNELTVLENVGVWLSLYENVADDLEEASVALLERFKLMEKAYLPASLLSRGQRYKLALVLYEGSRAPLGLFDEPFASGMDVPGIREMKKLLQDAVAGGRTVIYTTQLAEYARRFSERILVIHETQIYFDGPSRDFEQRLEAGDPVLQTFSESDE